MVPTAVDKMCFILVGLVHNLEVRQVKMTEITIGTN